MGQYSSSVDDRVIKILQPEFKSFWNKLENQMKRNMYD